MKMVQKIIVQVSVFVFFVFIGFPIVVHGETMSKTDLESFWNNYYGTQELDRNEASPKLSRTRLAKAAPDECFYGIGDTKNNFNPLSGNNPLVCPEAALTKVNQAYVWGLAKSGDTLWFGTAPNVQCMVLGEYLQAPIPNETSSWVCEFRESKFSPPLPEAVGDWRPPRIFTYDILSKKVSEKTPLSDPLIAQTLGIRSAGTLGKVVILGGPSLVSGINLFAFNVETGGYLGSTTLTAYANIRKWLVVNGVLYTAVGGADGGRVLRWTGSVQSPFQFQVVGKLGSESGAELAFHEGRLFVSTWPGTGELSPSASIGGLHMSPLIPAAGLAPANADQWTKVWAATDYEPDLVTAATYGGGALASFNGYLYWGTMHVPLMSALANISFYSQLIPDYPSTEQALEAVLGTYRSISIFRGKNFGQTAEVDLVYGMENLPKFSYDAQSQTGNWEIVPNAMGKSPVMGLSGFGNFFNNYTWTMGVYDGKLFVGTMDWSYLLYDLAKSVLLPWVTDFRESTISWPPFYFGADLWRFPESGGKAVSESVDGVLNYANYGIRTMISDDRLYLGMANPMNLFPLGGWEIVALEKADQDNDGVGDAEEDGAPNNGDGNGDGVLDKTQRNVASVTSGVRDVGYMTIQVISGCSQIRGAQTIAEDLNDPLYDYPFGLLRCQFFWPCSNVKVRVYYHGTDNLSAYDYRQYGPTPQGFNLPKWYTLPNVITGVAVVKGKNVAYEEYTLVDGALGDDTDVDGFIYHNGGPGLSVSSPTANTNSATSVSTTAATLNGTVNANNASTTVTFEYGPDTNYGTTVTADQSPVTGATATSVSKAITGLTPKMTYHYRVVGVNSGGTTNGADMTFTTGGSAPTITDFNPKRGGLGTVVTITGENFNGTAVKFGGTDADSFTVDSTTQITAVVGHGSTGKVTVTTDAGTATSTVDFTYDPSIPTLNEWALILLSILLIGSGVIVLRRGSVT